MRKRYDVLLVAIMTGLSWQAIANADSITDAAVNFNKAVNPYIPVNNPNNNAQKAIRDAASGINPTRSNASPSSNNTQTQQGQAYDLLTEAQASAVAADQAADSTHKKKPSDFLNRIADNTYAFLKAFNYYSLNWLQIYPTPSSNELDSLFGKYIDTSQTTFQDQLTFINSPNSLYSLDNPPMYIFKSTTPGATMNFATLVKQNSKNERTGEPEPVDPAIKKNAMYYVKNASGINFPHASPDTMAAGKNVRAINKYVAYYNAITSVSSYSAYLLSAHLADLQKDFKLSQIQMDLKSTASNNDWLSHVNEEQSIGVILRQLLLFTSQMYVVSLQQLETERQLLSAIAMTNSLAILANGNYEKTLYDDATK